MNEPQKPHEPFLHGWLKNNIFNKSGDAGAYFFFYMLIPVCVAIISLKVLSTDTAAIAYFYVTILISSLNCIYDAANRKSEKKSVRNMKLLLMKGFNVIVSGYCVFEILYLLITQTHARCDYILLAYLGVIIIGGIDVIYCFAKTASLYEYLECPILDDANADIKQHSDIT